MALKTVLARELSLEPQYINKNFEKSLDELLRQKVGDRCVQEGYVKRDSIKIVRRSRGKLAGSHLNGHFTFDVEFEADVVNPMSGDKLMVKVTNINKLGILAVAPPMSILIPREIHQDKDLFNGIELDDEIEIEVVDKKFQINGTEIDVVARIVPPVLEEPEPEDEEEVEGEQEGGEAVPQQNVTALIISDMPLNLGNDPQTPTGGDEDVLADFEPDLPDEMSSGLDDDSDSDEDHEKEPVIA